MNREAWLEAAVEKLRPIFLGKGYTVKELRVSVGWPSSGGLGTRKRAIGECWAGSTAADGKPQIFISPLLDEPTAPMGVLATLIHEVVHVVAGPEAKHGPKFAKIAHNMGLEGKPTSTSAGEELIERLKLIVTDLGAFPHSKLVPTKERKPQTTRMRKCECETCGFMVRMTQKWADVGMPICPMPNHGSMKLEMPEGGEGDE